jgi:di/tripeptidase
VFAYGQHPDGIVLIVVSKGSTVPVFNITEHYGPSDTRDFLVRNQRLGEAFARTFDDEGVLDRHERHNLVLMRSSHGFATIAADIKTATYQGVYALLNAKAQTETSKLLQTLRDPLAPILGRFTSREIDESWQTHKQLVETAWAGWVGEVKANPLYSNV